MQFYREREFGELLSDTFEFVKQYGKNYFKNYIVINGLIILLLLLVFYVGFGDLFQQFFGSNLEGQQFYFEDYFQQNQIVLVLSFLLLFAIYMLLSIVSYSYPIFFMQRVSRGDQEVTVNQIVNDIKANVGKLLKFFFGVLLIVMPIMIVVMFISGLLMFLLIGFFLILLILPAALNILNIAFFHYLHTDSGFFESLGYGFNAQFSKNFWKYWGSVILMYMILQIVASVFSIIPLFFGTSGSLFVEPEVGTNEAVSMAFMMIIYGLSFIVSFVLSNLIYINCGLMYYDSRKDLHRDMQFAEIENIGSSEI